MAVVFNGTTRQIEVTDNSIFELEAGKELYSEWKRWQQLDTANAGFAPAFRTFGGDATATGQFAPKYFFLINFWTILIDNGNVVNVALNLYSDDFITPYIVAPGSGVSDRNSDAVSINSEDIQHGSYDGGVTIDESSPYSGTAFPVGTPRQPVNNITDAETIAIREGFRNLYILNDITFEASDNLDNLIIHGESPPLSSFILTSGVSTVNTTFKECTITGTLTSAIQAVDCSINTLTGLGNGNLESVFTDCGIDGTITLGATATEGFHMVNCHSDGIGHNGFSIDVNGADCEILIINWFGPLDFINWTAGQDGSIEVSSGHIKCQASCTDGKLIVHGGTMFNDNSTGTFIMDVAGIINEDTIADQVWNEAKADHTDVGSMAEEIDETKAFSKKASDNAEQANLKL